MNNNGEALPVIPGYEVLELIKEEGQAVVYRARQRSINREVAIKMIRKHQADNPDFIRRFDTEAQLIARLEHPHITPLIDYWREPGLAYLVMRYLRGGSLQDALRNEGVYPAQAVLEFLDPISRALNFAHRHGVIHRDLKPGNILLDDEGQAYLADFGIAKDTTVINGDITGVDHILGTLDYIAPEQARGEPVTPRTDLYSLGVVLYEMLTGEHPFKDSPTIERFYKHINDPLPAIEHLPGLDAGSRDAINQIIQKATRKDPAERYPDVLALAAAFREALNIQGGSPVEKLTWREQEILQRICDGMTNKEIANDLFITQDGVRYHNKNLYNKLNVPPNRMLLILKARELNLVVTSDTDRDLGTSTGTQHFTLPDPENPYKGLRAFQQNDALDFFGREELIDRLIERIGEKTSFQRFLAIVGPSGSGKSSVVRAGLIPALRVGKIAGSEKWFIADIIPGNHPLEQLEIALSRIATDQTAHLNDHLKRDERGLLRAAELVLPKDGSELVVVVDQFEEVFTLVEDEGQRQHLLKLLHTAVTAPRSRVRIIVTLRADYFDQPLRYPEIGEMLRARMEALLPLGANALERAIRRPAERVGVSFEPGLVEQIVAEMTYQAAALPLLQYALSELFDRRDGRKLTASAYRAMGGAVGALANRADEIYLERSPEEQELIHQMFLRLVTLGEGAEDTRRRTSQSELLSLTNSQESMDSMEDIIANFADYRLLTLDHDPITRQPTVEVAHEAILREWERLREWLNDSREDIRRERILEHAAREWAAQNRDKSYLYSGAQLEQFETWTQQTKMVLTPLERKFIQAAIQRRTTEHEAVMAQQAHIRAQETRSRNLLRALVAVFALAALLSGGFGVFALQQRNDAQDNYENFRSIALSFGARDAQDKGDPAMATTLGLEAINTDDPPALAQQTFRDVAVTNLARMRFSPGGSTDISDARYLPDGRHIVVTTIEGRVSLWDLETNQEVKFLQMDGRARRIGLHPGGEIISFGLFEKEEFYIWNIVTDELRSILVGDGRHQPSTFTADGRTLVVGSDDQITIWDTESLTLKRSIELNEAVFASLEFNSDESLLVSASFDGYARIWDFETGELLKEINHNPEGSSTWVWEAQFLNNDQWLITASVFSLSLYDWRNEELIWSVPEEGWFFQDLMLSADEQWVVAALDGPPSAQIYETSTGRIIRSYYGHTDRTRSVDISPDGSALISGSSDGMIMEWPTRIEGTQLAVNLPIYAVNAMAQHPSQNLIAVTEKSDKRTANGTIYLMNTDTGEIVQELVGHPGNAAGFAFSPDGRTLISGDNNIADQQEQFVFVWDLESGEKVLEFTDHTGYIYALDISPDGRMAVTGDSNGNIFVWDLQSGEIKHPLEGHTNWVNSVIFSPDGRSIFSAASDGRIYRWDTETGEIFQQYGHGDGIEILLSPDGSRLVVLSRVANLTVILDAHTGQQLFTLTKGGSAAISPDGSRLAIYTASEGVITIWDINTGQEIWRYLAYELDEEFGTSTAHLSFDHSGERLISAGKNQMIIWEVPTENVDYAAWVRENRYIPDFTCEQREVFDIQPLCAAG